VQKEAYLRKGIAQSLENTEKTQSLENTEKTEEPFHQLDIARDVILGLFNFLRLRLNPLPIPT
jgi:hypothetical protein